MNKQSGAFLTIGELATELGLPQHILRYWETRFPMLRPLQRAGNRRYYRAEDVALVRRIHHLLNVEGYTVRGAQQALTVNGGSDGAVNMAPTAASAIEQDSVTLPADDASANEQLVGRLKEIRALLAAAL